MSGLAREGGGVEVGRGRGGVAGHARGGAAGGRTEEEEDACLLLAGLALAPILGACPTSPDVPNRLWCAQCVLS